MQNELEFVVNGQSADVLRVLTGDGCESRPGLAARSVAGAAFAPTTARLAIRRSLPSN